MHGKVSSDQVLFTWKLHQSTPEKTQLNLASNYYHPVVKKSPDLNFEKINSPTEIYVKKESFSITPIYNPNSASYMNSKIQIGHNLLLPSLTPMLTAKISSKTLAKSTAFTPIFTFIIKSSAKQNKKEM